jgi:hypothetical protein
MAISANAVWEVRSTATAGNANAGFFVTGASGTDYSQQNAAQYSLTGLTTSGASATMQTVSASADMVGNAIFISAGTNFTVGRYEIISVVAGVSITVDRNVSSGIGSNGVGAIGGALSLGSSDDAVFESLEPGNIMYVQSGTYTIGGTVTIAKSGTPGNIIIWGYQTTRGDIPTTSNRPTFNTGAVIFTLGAFWNIRNMNFVSTGATVLTTGTNARIIRCRIMNTSTTAGRNAISTGNVAYLEECEFISYRGFALNSNGSCVAIACWMHSSDIGVRAQASNQFYLFDCIISSCVTSAIGFNVAFAGHMALKNCTLYGAENTTGIGINIPADSTGIRVVNSIIYGFTTGIAHADAAQGHGYERSCAFFNNDMISTNWTAGQDRLTAVDPMFNNVHQITGTAATTSGAVLTDASKDFTALGVIAGRDYIYITGGTGVTAGYYGISTVGTTTLTLDIAPGDSAVADKTYQITTGQNFEVTTNDLNNQGFPGSLAGGYTIGYTDIGAVQQQSSGGAGGSSSGGLGYRRLG